MLVSKQINRPDHSAFHVAYQEPDICPVCKHAIKPETIGFHYYVDPHAESGENEFLPVMYLCHACFKCFLVLYRITDVREYNGARQCVPVYAAPNRYKPAEFDRKIADLSPDFVTIYNQALAAESDSLDQIAGIGYRKALEFLVKDFCIHLHPEDAEQIRKKMLGRVITDYIDNPQIRTLAERAVWIGNDETHYVRKHEDRDISDMKEFIRAMVYFVGMMLIAEDAASMSPR